MSVGTYPFGSPLHPVVQTDRGPKKVFVLGVYASAVHARWIGSDGKPLVTSTGGAGCTTRSRWGGWWPENYCSPSVM